MEERSPAQLMVAAMVRRFQASDDHITRDTPVQLLVELDNDPTFLSYYKNSPQEYVNKKPINHSH
jgi:hypothetical protein